MTIYLRRPEVMKQSFKTTTAGVGELARWLADLEVTRVVMESTGVYWKPVFYVLEDAIQLLGLQRPAHAATSRGARQISPTPSGSAQLVGHGLVRPSFVPPKPINGN